LRPILLPPDAADGVSQEQEAEAAILRLLGPRRDQGADPERRLRLAADPELRVPGQVDVGAAAGAAAEQTRL
jgi:hypothetical protein